MLPFKRVLAPTDFSEPALHGLQAAEELARHFSAELVMIHVVAPVMSVPPAGPPAHSGLQMSAVMQELEDAARKTLNETAEQMSSRGIRARWVVMQGNPADEIAAAAGKEEADVVVIATHGWTGWRRFV
ncbi:MAG: universal stress protein, partial [Desulfobacteraceae bacterium]